MSDYLCTHRTQLDARENQELMRDAQHFFSVVAIFNFHVQVNGPDVYSTCRVLEHAFKVGPSSFFVAYLELVLAKFDQYGNVCGKQTLVLVDGTDKHIYHSAHHSAARLALSSTAKLLSNTFLASELSPRSSRNAP